MRKTTTIKVSSCEIDNFKNQYQIELECRIRKEDNIEDIYEIKLIGMDRKTELKDDFYNFKVEYEVVMDSEMADDILKMEERIRSGL